MLRKFAVGLAALGALNAAQVKALGLGEVTIHSALNQPLDAEIELLQLRDLSASQIISSLADSDEFYLAGVKPTAILSDIRFQLDIKDGKGKIRLSTREPIREPFLNFLVEVNWPSGRLVREYTVLLDPPVFTAKDLAPRPMPQVPMAPSSAATPVAPAPSAPAMAPTSAPMAGASQYAVGNKDTLWNIALKTRPDRTVSVQQMMLAIQKTNPSAFIDNNINRLRSGVVLNIPTKQQILALDFAESVSEVKRQNSAWKTEPAPGKAAKPEGERLDAAKAQPADKGDEAVKEEDAQLRIVSAPAQTEKSDEAGQTVSADTPEQAAEQNELLAKNQELEEQLVVTLEGLDKVERDNAELFQRLEQLGEQMESLQRLVTLKDQQLADLENQLKEAAAKPAPVPAPAPAPAATDLLKSPAVLGGAGAAILALLGGLFFFMRKKKQSEEQAVEDAMAVLDAQESVDQPVTAAAAAAAAAEALEPEVPEQALDDVAVEEDPNDPFNLASDDDLGDFGTEALEGELGDDLEMDLKIDEPVEQDAEMEEFAESLLSDDEYDIAVDEAEPAADELGEDDLPDVDLDETGMAESDDLDFILGDTETEFEAPEPEVAAESEAEEEDLLGDLDDILGEQAPEVEEESAQTSEIDDDIQAVMEETDAEMDVSGLETIEPVVDEEEEFVGDEMLDDLLSKADEVEDVESATHTEVDLEAADLAFAEAPAEDDEVAMVVEDDLAPELEIVEEAAESTESAVDADLDDIDALLAETAADAEESVESEASGDAEVAAEADDIDAIMADLGADDIADVQEADASIAEEVAETESDVDSIMAEMEASVAEEAPEPADAVAVAESGLELGDLELEDESAGSKPEPVAVEAKPEPDAVEVADAASELVLDNELDSAGDDELEAELSLMLEEEDNALALEESGADTGSEVDYLDGADEVGTKLDLARAYLDMDDQDGARDILQEVIAEGNDEQKTEAQELLKSIG